MEPTLIIGAGPAGLACAYFLKQNNLPYRIIDKSDVIASTWASLYPSLKFNTTRFFSHMPGKPFPLSFGIYPKGRQYHAYLVEFAREQGIEPEFGVTVERVTPEAEGYRVTTDQWTAWFPHVVIASGRFSNPHIPDIPGLDALRQDGRVLHANQYRTPDPLIGQRVMVVGNGPSGVDIAVELGRHNHPDKPTLLAIRTGVNLRRRYPMGIPKHGWMMLARFLPKSIGDKLVETMTSVSFAPAQLDGIKTPPPDKSSTAVAVHGPDLIRAVRDGHVVSVDAPVRFDGREAVLQDGSRHAVDTVIMATGYRPALGFLDGLDITLTGQAGQFWPQRERSMAYQLDFDSMQYRGTYDLGPELDAEQRPLDREIAGYPGLFLTGVYYKGKGTTYNVNVEGEVVAHQIKARLTSQGDEHLQRVVIAE